MGLIRPKLVPSHSDALYVQGLEGGAVGDYNAVVDDKLQAYANPEKAKGWFSRNFERLQAVFGETWVRDFIFEPIKGVFEVRGDRPEDEIRSIITRVAVANAVLAGLPGKMGVGVVVSMAMEAWMANAIANRIGIVVKRPADIFKYFSVIAGIGATILWFFKQLLGVLFSLFSFVSVVNPLIPAELVATNFIGVLFWFGFAEAAKRNGFTVPKRAFRQVVGETKKLYKFQWQILRHSLSAENLKSMGLRLRAWLTGEIPVDKATVRGDLFPTAAMAYLMAAEYDRLQGPLGEEFIAAIKDRFPDLEHASLPEIADHMSQYDADSLVGVLSLIKGKLFERLVTKYENADGDHWSAEMHNDESWPGSDVVFSNADTGEQIEVSLKASLNPSYLEAAWQKYPDIPIMGPEELNGPFADHPGHMPSSVSHEQVTTVTNENFEMLLGQLDRHDAAEMAAGGVATGAAIGLWPFVVAYLRKRIDFEQLSRAFERVLGEAGPALAARVSYGVVLGPVFAWYLLARGVFGVVAAGEKVEKPVMKLMYSGRAPSSIWTPEPA